MTTKVIGTASQRRIAAMTPPSTEALVMPTPPRAAAPVRQQARLLPASPSLRRFSLARGHRKAPLPIRAPTLAAQSSAAAETRQSGPWPHARRRRRSHPPRSEMVMIVPSPGSAGDGEVTAMQRHQALHQRQAEAGAFDTGGYSRSGPARRAGRAIPACRPGCRCRCR